MKYSVSEICKKTGLTKKLLYDYEEEKIIMPTGRRTQGYINRKGKEYRGYKEYDEEALVKFHQVAIFRRLDMERAEIKRRMTAPDYNSNRVLDEQIELLKREKERIEELIMLAEELKMLGVNNPVAQQFAKMDLTKLTKMTEGWKESQKYQYLEDTFDRGLSKGFEEAGESLFKGLHQMSEDTNDEISQRNARNCVDAFKEKYGFCGWIIITNLGLYGQGDGSVAFEFDEIFETSKMREFSSLIVKNISRDLSVVDNTINKIIYKTQQKFGEGYIETGGKQMIEIFKQILKKYIGITTKEDYELAFEYFAISQYAMSEKGLYFALNQIKQHGLY